MGWSKKYKKSINCNNPKGFSQKAHCAGRKKQENKMSLKLEELVGKPITEQQFDEAAGKKDACYHKVKARYDVWPSAYASGALVKCRKVGAKNWGNKSKKENIEENKKLVGVAIGIAKKMGGNMTGAIEKIEKLSKGLSKVKPVQDALRKANEGLADKFMKNLDKYNKKAKKSRDAMKKLKKKEGVNERDNVAMAYKRTLSNKVELKKLKDAIEMFQKKIKKQGMATNARDEDHLANLIKVYKDMGGKGVRESVNEGRVLHFTQIKDKTLEKHLKVIAKKVGAVVSKIPGGFKVDADSDGRKLAQIVDYIFDKSLMKGLMSGGGMSRVQLVNESINEQQYFDPKGELKIYMDKVLKKAGIRVIKFDPMKQSFYNGIWGGFYTVASSNKVDMPGQGKVKRSSAVLPVYIDKRNQIELGVSGDGFDLGKVGSSQVLKNLKDFNKSDLQEGLVKEGSIEQRELKLYIDNDGQLYRQRYTPIEKNLTKKMEKGKYDSKLAVKLFMYLVDDGAKKYVKDFGGNVRDMFPKKDRIEVAKEFRDEFETEYKVRNESYDIWVEDGSFGGTFTGLVEAEYQGRKVKLNKPMQGDSKKFKVYVKNDKGNVVKVNFGQGGDAKGGTMRIRKSNPKARANFRARHNCDNPGPRHKARYWSCKKW